MLGNFKGDIMRNLIGLSAANKIVLIVWIVGTIVLDAIDIVTTMIPMGQESVYENNAFLKFAMDTFGPEIGLLVFGTTIKLFYIVFFSIMFMLGCRFITTTKDKSPVKEKLFKVFSFGVLYAVFLILWLIKIPAIIGNTDPYKYT